MFDGNEVETNENGCNRNKNLFAEIIFKVTLMHSAVLK